MKRVIFILLFAINPSVYANNISVDTESFINSIKYAERNPDFIERGETGDGSQFVTFRERKLDHDNVKVVIEKAFNADSNSLVRLSIIQHNLSCIPNTTQRTFYFFDLSGKLITMKEQNETVLPMEFKEIACSEKK